MAGLKKCPKCGELIYFQITGRESLERCIHCDYVNVLGYAININCRCTTVSVSEAMDAEKLIKKAEKLINGG